MRFSLYKRRKELYDDDDFMPIFNMRFNLKSNFTTNILKELFDVVSNSAYHASSSIDGVSDAVNQDFHHLRSALEYIQGNIDSITELVVAGSAFLLVASRWEDENYQVEIKMKVKKHSEFYVHLLESPIENSKVSFLTAVEAQ